KMPAVAIELTSKKTKKEDQVDKPALYAGWGIEYTFLYDVLADYLKPPLQGMRLGGDGRYRSLVGPGTGPLPCPPLGLDLILDDDGRLQFVDRETGKIVVRERLALDQSLEALRRSEAALEEEAAARRQEAAARRQAEERAEQEAEARQKAEADQQKAEADQQKAEADKQKAEAELEREAQVRLQAEERIRELLEENERLMAQLGQTA
ncbi:MAG: hypothetical protein GY856_02330, partial [bacterium]|nr:hypothetical protein [bacterium]